MLGYCTERQLIAKYLPLLEFKVYIVNTLIQMNTKRKGRPLNENTPNIKKRLCVSALSEVRYDGVSHYPEKQ